MPSGQTRDNLVLVVLGAKKVHDAAEMKQNFTVLRISNWLARTVLRNPIGGQMSDSDVIRSSEFEYAGDVP